MDKANPTQAAKQVFARAKQTEKAYARRLRKIAAHIGDIVRPFHPAEGEGFTQEAVNLITATLHRYSESIRSWAEVVGHRMVAEVNSRDEAAWMRVSRQMGRSLRKELDTAPTGEVVRRRLADQVDLITSLPREAAERVHKLALEGIVQGRRPAEIAAEIMRTGEVTKSRATLIARTEVSRTATELTKARAEHVGSTMFQWATAGDNDVRDSHRRLNGKVFKWDDPPECDPGYRALPGCIWNCRCFPIPIFDDVD